MTGLFIVQNVKLVKKYFVSSVMSLENIQDGKENVLEMG